MKKVLSLLTAALMAFFVIGCTDAKVKPKTNYSLTKAMSQAPSLGNTCFPPLENESSLQKANSMRLHVKKLCRGGRWYLYLAVPLRQRSRFNGLSPGSRVMRRLSCSSTMTRLAVRRRRMQQASCHLGRRRLHDWRYIRMLQTRYRQTIRN